MSDISGIWQHASAYGGRNMTIRHTLDPSGSYHTEMVYPMHGGQQNIHHYGTYHANDGKLRLQFDRGETEMVGCTDPANNFPMRPFTQDEIDEAKGLLEQDFGFELSGDTLTTTIQSPMGEMKVAYKRQDD